MTDRIILNLDDVPTEIKELATFDPFDGEYLITAQTGKLESDGYRQIFAALAPTEGLAEKLSKWQNTGYEVQAWESNGERYNVGRLRFGIDGGDTFPEGLEALVGAWTAGSHKIVIPSEELHAPFVQQSSPE